MARSRVIDDEAQTIVSARYGYDPLGRRSVVQNNSTTTLRTLYDGLSFDVVKESPVFNIPRQDGQPGNGTDTLTMELPVRSTGI